MKMIQSWPSAPGMDETYTDTKRTGMKALMIKTVNLIFLFFSILILPSSILKAFMLNEGIVKKSRYDIPRLQSRILKNNNSF